METAIKLEQVMKQYSDKPVLKGVSFSVNKGEIFALLGVNGAGKTTTLECIEGLRTYDSGQITINGKIGVQLQSSSLPEHIKVKEALVLFANWAQSHIDNGLTNKLGLAPLENKKYKDLSTGQQRRLHLALAMIGNPDILFLDEPTAGLDVEGRAALHEVIRELNSTGTTIIMASHDMAEVEALCHRIAILKEGHIAFLGTARELTAQAQDHYKILFKASVKVSSEALTTSRIIDEHQGYQIAEAENLEDSLLELLTFAKSNSIRIYDLRIEHASLEQRFLDIAKEGQA
ncbi:Fluoroquinolones export ATP-binding protein [compost metagenome]